MMSCDRKKVILMVKSHLNCQNMYMYKLSRHFYSKIGSHMKIVVSCSKEKNF